MAENKLSPSALPIEVEIKESKLPKKRAVLYARVSTGDQYPETQLLDLHEMAKQRGYAMFKNMWIQFQVPKRKDPVSTDSWPMRVGIGLMLCLSLLSTGWQGACDTFWSYWTN